MCGAACTMVAGPRRAASTHEGSTGLVTSPLLALHAGRVVGYAAMGALVAASVSGLGTFDAAAPMLRPLWVRVLIVAVCAIWAAVEFLTGSGLWGVVFLALGGYAFWGFFLDPGRPQK